MAKGKTIICPYCCNKFQPDKVDFRLERPLEAANDAEEDESEAEEEQKPSMMGIHMQKTVAKTKNIKRQGKSEGRVIDEKLCKYYMNYLHQSRDDAESNSVLLPAAAFDSMSPDFEYDSRIYSEYGYVTEVTYRGQILTNRLCPLCHNPVVSNAGKYDMMIISVIGDTNVGKSIYLLMLGQMLKQDREFDGSMLFMGTDAEKEMYFGNVDKLLNKKMLEANVRQKVPPMPFLYKFKVPGKPDKQSAIIVFCDIAGEDCRDSEALKRNGYHLKISSGIFFLIDPTRFSRIKNVINFDKDNASMISNRHQYTILEAINQYLMNSPDIDKSDIPTAIVLTKCDELKGLPYFTTDGSHMALLEDTRGADMHPGYLSIKETNNLNSEIEEFLNKIDELQGIKDLFNTYSFFFSSPLGMTPEYVDIENDGVTTQEKRVRNIQPYRVTEPFYWILMQNGLIPCKNIEAWRNKKGQEKKVVTYFYEDEAPASVENQKKANRVKEGIVEKEGLSAIFGQGWEKLYSEDA